MPQAPALELVTAALVSRLVAIGPTTEIRTRFERSSEQVASEALAAKSCLRKFNVDPLDGLDESQEGNGNGVQNAGLSDQLARFRISIAYPRARQEKHIEDVLVSDAGHALRALARSADWNGTPVRRAVCRWTVDRMSSSDKLFLVLTLAVQYRDAT